MLSIHTLFYEIEKGESKIEDNFFFTQMSYIQIKDTDIKTY